MPTHTHKRAGLTLLSRLPPLSKNHDDAARRRASIFMFVWASASAAVAGPRRAFLRVRARARNVPNSASSARSLHHTLVLPFAFFCEKPLRCAHKEHNACFASLLFCDDAFVPSQSLYFRPPCLRTLHTHPFSLKTHSTITITHIHACAPAHTPPNTNLPTPPNPCALAKSRFPRGSGRGGPTPLSCVEPPSLLSPTPPFSPINRPPLFFPRRPHPFALTHHNTATTHHPHHHSCRTNTQHCLVLHTFILVETHQQTAQMQRPPPPPHTHKKKHFGGRRACVCATQEKNWLCLPPSPPPHPPLLLSKPSSSSSCTYHTHTHAHTHIMPGKITHHHHHPRRPQPLHLCARTPLSRRTPTTPSKIHHQHLVFKSLPLANARKPPVALSFSLRIPAVCVFSTASRANAPPLPLPSRSATHPTSLFLALALSLFQLTRKKKNGDSGAARLRAVHTRVRARSPTAPSS